MKKDPQSRLTTTSYALLGLLCRQPWSAYELNKYMRWSALRRVWPRAESRIYEEPKKLVAAGLASVDQEYQGARKRSVYTVTEAGREAFALWFAQPCAALVYEYESLVKLIHGDLVEVDALQKLVEKVRQEAKEEASAIADGCETILEEGWRIPETAEHNAWLVNFMRMSIEARLRWADTTDARLEQYQRGNTEASLARARGWYLEEIDALRRLID